MDQKKFGLFLKELRKEKGLTQEQLAEVLGVSNRSISRWENGVNMPDFDLVMEMAKFFDIAVGELLDAERKEDMMDMETEESLLKVADYGSYEKLVLSKRLRGILAVGLLALSVSMVLEARGLTEIAIYDNISSFMLGLVFGVLVTGIIYTTRSVGRVRAFKLRILSRNQ
ncbi:MAG: helix-turn-helix domain-containing protein [Limnochordia bacterium]|jgi:transcriptional regulator with XRE-family HTH domain|nr:helix-turn-helix domain-containing protein [Limnochordia bacterium]